MLSLAGTQALEAARYASSLGTSGLEEAALRRKIAEISSTLQEVQHAVASAGVIGLGEDLLSLELATLQLNQAIHSSPDAALPNKELAALEAARPRILIADDDEGNRDILIRLLRAEPWELHSVSSGAQLLSTAASQAFDLILLDVLMPGMNGLEVLRRLREDDRLRDIPVIMLSGIEEVENVIACLHLGARDYISKPFNPLLLRARLRSALDHRQLSVQARERAVELERVLADLSATRLAQEQLIESLLPQRAIAELKQHAVVRPAYHNDVTVLFTDFVGFTAACSVLTAYELVNALNDYFTAFDQIVGSYGLERLKTVGDAYICTAGLSSASSSHPIDAVLASFDMLTYVRERAPNLPRWEMRIGINTGPVVSGIVGTQRLAFDIWGDTVNLAARMVSAGAARRINVSCNTFQRVKEFFACEARGSIPIKGNQTAEMFFVQGPSLPLAADTHVPLETAFRSRYHSYFQSSLRRIPTELAAMTPTLG